MASNVNAPEQPPPAPRPPRPAYQTDPGYINAENTYNQQETGLADFLRQQRSQALINFGAPGLLKGLGFSVDPNTMGAAAANPYSIYALLGKSRDDTARGIVNNLAGRGLVHSGDYGYLNGQNAQNYGKALYTAEQQLLAGLSDAYQNYLGQHNQNLNNRNAAEQGIEQNYVDNPPPATAQDALYGLGSGAADGAAANALAKLLSPGTLLRILDDRQWRAAGGSHNTTGPASPPPQPTPENHTTPIGNLINLLR